MTMVTGRPGQSCARASMEAASPSAAAAASIMQRNIIVLPGGAGRSLRGPLPYYPGQRLAAQGDEATRRESGRGRKKGLEPQARAGVNALERPQSDTM